MAGLMATWMVVARSVAEMPVVTPNRRWASMLTVKAVDSSSVFRSVIWGKPELIAALAGQGQADQTPAVQGHEVDHLGRSKLRGTDEIALVLAILVVGYDDDLAVAQIVDRLLDCPECGHVLPK